jgi:hypothetical protein
MWNYHRAEKGFDFQQKVLFRIPKGLKNNFHFHFAGLFYHVQYNVKSQYSM